MTTPYTNLSVILNPHLHISTHVGHRPFAVHCAQRNPPKILTWKNEFLEGIAKFGFNDTVFSTPHMVWFPNQVAETRTPVTTLVELPKVIDLNYLWCTEYFHFFTEVLPNALFLTNTGVKYPIFCRTSKFTEPAFRWFGITNEIVSSLPPLKTKQVVPIYVECGNPSFQKIRLLRDVIESKVHFKSTHGILIRRHGSRELLNEEEVFNFFQKKYPELTWVIFDVLSIEDTATLFSKAAKIIAPHGAGLTNMIFAPKGTEILEFMPASDPNLCYWHLSEMLGHSYTMLPVPCNKQNSMIVDISLFEMLK
jgi:hypothetical protein